ncbi:MAG: Gfo/Idh/MocA family oxidoreductase [Candidatus Sumerlaeia bacterium]|nr:Gfo/Idh/MocA family oxidoreductase [Candidatus Sumerlaeia bacterium]
MKRRKELNLSRRAFTKSAALAAGTAMVGTPLRAATSKPKTLKIGWIGAGDRGAADIRFCLDADDNIEVVAIADLFPDQVKVALDKVGKKFQDRIKVTKDTTFFGFDAYKKVLEMPEVDIVFLTTPPFFRPVQFRAAIEAGKHCFVEKPGAVDPVGVRSILETTEMARKKNLSVVVGMQQRWMPQYQEIVKRVQDGEIGEIRHVGAYWIGTMMTWHWQPRESVKSDLEWQIRCWPQLTWLSGDCCVEQLVHNLDVSNWVLGTTPLQVVAVGGRLARVGDQYGTVYDHFAFDFDYPGGLKGLGINAQIEKVTNKVCNTITGSKGEASVSRGHGFLIGPKGRYEYKGSMDGDGPMHQAMCEGIRKGEPVNQGQILCEATLTGIIGRMSAYSGKPVGWEWALKQSKLDLTPKQELSFDKPFPMPPVQMPSNTELI